MTETTTPAAADTSHKNEQWWKANGGAPWMAEVARRRSTQPHYGEQEAFLLGFMSALPKVRALDFGCGFARHLKNLSALPHLELHGCDISPAMIETSKQNLGDSPTASRLKLIDPRGRLPWPDNYFDVVYTSEVLIHVASVDLPVILRELWRVSSSLVLHIENRRVEGSRQENDAHDGCWLHDFPAAWSEITAANVHVLPHAVQRQCVYWLAKPGSTLEGRAASDVANQAGLEQAVIAERHRSAKLAHQLAKLQAQRDDLEQKLTDLNRAPVMRVAQRVIKSPTLRGASERAARLISRASSELEARGLSLPQTTSPEPKELEEQVDLSFAGVATRASKASPTEFVEAQPKRVILCHPEWRGIRGASYGQGEHVLEVPGVQSLGHARRLLRFLADCGTEQVVMNGFPPGTELLAASMKRLMPEARFYLVYHGAPALREHDIVDKIVKLADGNLLHKIGFVKQGMAEYFRTRGYPAEFVMNICRVSPQPVKLEPDADGKFHVGVFAPDVMHKNLATQLMAALMVPDTVVHTLEPIKAEYLNRERRRLVEHGMLKRQEFLQVLSKMHATSYVSLTECYPMTVLESLFLGAVCVTSDTSAIFEGSKELADALVVSRSDNPYAIATKLASALANRSTLVPKAQAYLNELNERAEARWVGFLEG